MKPLPSYFFLIYFTVGVVLFAGSFSIYQNFVGILPTFPAPNSATDSTLLSLDFDTLDMNLTDSVRIDSADTSFKNLTLNDLLVQFDTSEFMRHASFGFCLKDTKTGEILKSRNPNQSLVPASVMKIVTTGTVLELAGANYQFRTRLQYDGELDTINHVLNGNIYIRGGGDPTLGSNVFTGNDQKNLMNRWKKAI